MGECVMKSERLSGGPKSFEHTPERDRVVCVRRLSLDRRIRLRQVRELARRFGLSRLEHYAMVLQVPCKEAEKLLAMAGITLSKD